MDKRTVIAMVLLAAILLTWSLFNQQSTPPLPAKSASSETIVADLPSEPVIMSQSIEAQKVTYNIADREFVLNESTGTIISVLFKKYQDALFTLGNSTLISGFSGTFQLTKRSTTELEFTGVDQWKKIVKRFIFDNNSYIIDLEINVSNISSGSLEFSPSLLLGILDFSIDPTGSRYKDIAAGVEDKMIRPGPTKSSSLQGVKFLSMRDQYFCAIISPVGDTVDAYTKASKKRTTEVGITPSAMSIPSGQSRILKYSIYLGPQELDILSAANPAWQEVMYYGVFNVISHILLSIVDFLHGLVRNWGVAIILLTCLVYLVLFPLSIKQMRSMKEMQALQPKVEALKKAHKDNPQKFNKEVMELYREHKVNPLGGCLPMVLQIPIFFALYQALSRSIALKGAPFLWVKDLSRPDRLLTFNFSIPVLGNELNVLPILMVLVMFFQQKYTSAATAATATEQQKMMLIVMPAMFLFIFYHMPAGLVLYWLVNSSLMLLFQLRIQRRT